MDFSANWIRPGKELGDTCPVFRKTWQTDKPVVKAELKLTALGVYEAKLNGKRVGEFVLAPGWTAYQKRLQVQTYDVTNLLQKDNELQITVGKGWLRSPMPGFVESDEGTERQKQPAGIFGELQLDFADGTKQIIPTDATWEYGESSVRFSEIYDGEIYDAEFATKEWLPAEVFAGATDTLIPQEGEEAKEMERVAAQSVFETPAGETVVDFGQEITGYVEFTIDAKAGEKVRLLHGEVLDKEGNFYNANYRSAKAEINYTCCEGKQTWHPELTFFGFRYVKLADFPGTPSPEQFTGIVLYSNMKQTGSFSCSNPKLNQLFSNILWGQKGNFLDVPTDCPQRDERLGWTGDAQVFVKAASYNFDCEKFFCKWLQDLSADQRTDGGVGQVIPDYLPDGAPSAGWGDAATICPWQIYQTYGNKEVLERQFNSMKRWVDYITHSTTTANLWTGGEHFGDWLGLDAPIGSYKGSSREDFIASAFYAYSTALVIKAGHVLGASVDTYEELYKNILKAFHKTYPEYKTQTEHVIALQFDLAANPQVTADALAEMILADECQIKTGFIGTPYILHVLSRYGHSDIAYSLLLREAYPGWLYPVNKGATTIWEHWDGIMENGDFWSTDMNSFNHYAYGSVADWLYEEAAGIQPLEAGFKAIRIEPKPDKRLGWLEAAIDTREGKVSSKWTITDHHVRYEIATPVPATLVIDGKENSVPAGTYTYWGKISK